MLVAESWRALRKKSPRSKSPPFWGLRLFLASLNATGTDTDRQVPFPLCHSHITCRLMNTASRRHFIKSIAGATGAAALGGAPFGASAREEKKARGGQFTDIQHIVLVMMENRSFDHFLGWLPGANGIPAGGLVYPDRSGALR